MKFYLSLYGHRLPVMALDVSDDSQMIASGSADKNVRLWSTQFGNCLKSLKAHAESVMQAVKDEHVFSSLLRSLCILF